MMIGCYAINCKHGYIYVRGEYFPSIKSLNEAIDELYAAGLLGENALGKGKRLDLTVHTGAGVRTSVVKNLHCSIHWRASAVIPG